MRTILAILLLVLASEGSKDPLCEPPFAVTLENGELVRFENGTILHDGVSYPSGFHRSGDGLVYGCLCKLRRCIRKCCPAGEVLQQSSLMNCTEAKKAIPEMRLENDQAAESLRNVSLTEEFVLIEDRSCEWKTLMLEPESFEEDKFVLNENGTIFTMNIILNQWEYCMDWHESLSKITVLICVSPNLVQPDVSKNERMYHLGIAFSIPFLLATFVVYAIVPELRNLYGKTLMSYVGCLLIAYISLVLAGAFYIPEVYCEFTAFIIHFSFLASFFWLNVMCFDIWWTFGGFRSLQGSVKQRERKKFVIYSIYAWGSASFLTGICIIMEFVPDLPTFLIRPQFGSSSCWFSSEAAKAVYFYGPMGVTVFCNVCLFISTALKILRHKKNTANQLKGSESRRHDENRQWFNLYLKLFIVMGINWSMEIISWLFDSSPSYLWYITDLANTLQGVIIFVIFVWKEKIKRLLLKRLGCKNTNVLSRNSTRSIGHSTASRTCMTSAPLHEKVNPYQQDPYRNRATIEESDCA